MKPAGHLQIAPSILSADFAALGDAIAVVERGGADQIHVDVMDGHFVPNITIGPPVVAALKRRAKVPLDVHLMIEDPDRYVEAFVHAGASMLTVHAEAAVHLHRTVHLIQSLGAKAGVALNPATPVVALEELAKSEGTFAVPVCAALEAQIAELDPKDRPEFLESAGLKEPGLYAVIRAGYKLLGLLTFFTAGKQEVRAWTTKIGARAPQAAGVIHTDFEKGFIKAEVIWWEDLVTLGSEAKCRDAGKLAIEGKEYVMRDGDVVHFRFNV